MACSSGGKGQTLSSHRFWALRSLYGEIKGVLVLRARKIQRGAGLQEYARYYVLGSGVSLKKNSNEYFERQHTGGSVFTHFVPFSLFTFFIFSIFITVHSTYSFRRRKRDPDLLILEEVVPSEK